MNHQCHQSLNRFLELSRTDVSTPRSWFSPVSVIILDMLEGSNRDKLIDGFASMETVDEELDELEVGEDLEFLLAMKSSDTMKIKID